MNVHTIHITNHWFKLLKSGKKNVDYRECKPYWDARIKHILDNDIIKFVRGYTEDFVLRKVFYVDRIPFSGLPHDEQYFFDDKNKDHGYWFYAIRLFPIENVIIVNY